MQRAFNEALPSAEGRREGIVRCAAELFQVSGYHQTSMTDVARAVGLRKPTIYHYFASKEDILMTIHLEFIEMLRSRFEDQVARNDSAIDILRGVMTSLLSIIETNPGHVRVFFEHVRDLSEDRIELVRESNADFRRKVADVIRSGIDAGELRPVDPKLAALALFGMCNWAYQWFRSGGSHTSEEVAEAFFDFLVCGLGASPGKPLASGRWESGS